MSDQKKKRRMCRLRVDKTVSLPCKAPEHGLHQDMQEETDIESCCCRHLQKMLSMLGCMTALLRHTYGYGRQ